MKMNGKVTVVIDDDTDDEILTFYSINKDGVIVIDDDCSTTSTTDIVKSDICGSKDLNVENKTKSKGAKENSHLLLTSNDNKSTSQKSSDSTVDSNQQTCQDPKITKKCQNRQSPCKNNQTNQSLRKNNQTLNSNKKTLISSNTFPCSNASSTSNINNNHSVSATLLDNRDKSLCTSTENQHTSSLPDGHGCFVPTTKQNVSVDSNFKVTIKNNSSDKRKVNGNSPDILVKDSRQAPSQVGHSSQDRDRRKSAPTSMTFDSSVMEKILYKQNKNSHPRRSSCSTEVKSNNGQSHFTHERSQKRKRENSMERESQYSSVSEKNRTNYSTNDRVGSNVEPNVSHKKRRMRSCSASTSALPQTSVASGSGQTLSNLPTDSLENLSTYLHIIFIDLDNWGKFFNLPYPLPPKVFVWGFCGGNYTKKRSSSVHFHALIKEKRFFQHPMCGKSKNAADFALCVQAARLDLQLPKHIPFTVLSGDKGFGELKAQLSSSERKIHLLDPHLQDQDILHATLSSIGET